MKELTPGSVYIDISRNQSGGLTLCICNDDFGYRMSGDKVSGCSTLKRFEVDGEDLIEQIRQHMKKASSE